MAWWKVVRHCAACYAACLTVSSERLGINPVQLVGKLWKSPDNLGHKTQKPQGTGPGGFCVISARA